jgi:hypothetical protein
MVALSGLQAWYLAQCDGDWEHSCGIRIETLDNPGWSLVVDLTDTHMDGREFDSVERGVGGDSSPDDQDWLACKVSDNKFVAHGGPQNLAEMITVFLRWTRAPR